MNKIRILIADDHKIVRMGLKALLSSEKDLAVVGEADDGKVAVSEALRLKPDIVIMDLMMPEMDGETATAELSRQLPSAKVVVLTSVSTSDRIVSALEAGARGAILKTTDDTTLLNAIRRIAEGRQYVSPSIQRLIATDPPVEKLSQRQQEVLESLTQGLNNKDIALKLGISNARVEELIATLLSKIDAANRTEAVAIALKKHLVKI
mgnify:CR=1 FL=1